MAGVFSFGLDELEDEEYPDFFSLLSRSLSLSRSLEDEDPLLPLLLLPELDKPSSLLPPPPPTLLDEPLFELGDPLLVADFSADILGLPPPELPPEMCFGDDVP